MRKILEKTNSFFVFFKQHHLFTGTWEVFYTDILQTHDKMKAADVDVRLHMKKKMGHVYPPLERPRQRYSKERLIIVKVIFRFQSVLHCSNFLVSTLPFSALLTGI